MKMDHRVGVLFAAARYHRPGLKCGYWFIALSVIANAMPPPPKWEASLGSPFGKDSLRPEGDVA